MKTVFYCSFFYTCVDVSGLRTSRGAVSAAAAAATVSGRRIFSRVESRPTCENSWCFRDGWRGPLIVSPRLAEPPAHGERKLKRKEKGNKSDKLNGFQVFPLSRLRFDRVGSFLSSCVDALCVCVVQTFDLISSKTLCISRSAWLCDTKFCFCFCFCFFFNFFFTNAQTNKLANNHLSSLKKI